MNDTYDIVIVGCGIVGLTLAVALAKCGLNLVLLEKSDSPNTVLKHADIRVSAIHLASQKLFESLGVWDQMAQGVSPFTQIEVFESHSSGMLHFDSTLIASPYLGFIAEHKVLIKSLLTALSHYSVEIRYQSTLQTAKITEDKARLTLENGDTLTSRLVVGADGMHSTLRQLVGISMSQYDYQQTALVANVQTEKPHETIARQCFRPQGPLAFLPLKAPHHCSIVWSTSPDEASTLQTLPDESFNLNLASAFNYHLGNVAVQSPRIHFPLKMRYAKPFVLPRLALVGDAVHTIHPLAGQGLNLGLMDAAYLAQVITDVQRSGNDIGDYGRLRRYERGRKSQHAAMIVSMELLKRGFGINTPLCSAVRNQLMLKLNQAHFMKRQLISLASGTSKY